jgi:hypothetical protein
MNSETPKDSFQRITEWAPTPPVDLLETLAAVEAFFNRFVVFSNRSQSTVIALWVLHAWAKNAFDYTPYLHIHSPEKRCGKTLVLDLLGLLVPEPWPVVGPSEAVLFRAIDANEPTLLLDEVDTIFKERDEKSEGLRGILNAGFKRNGSVPRCVGQGHEVKNFSVFCPKVLAGIGRLPDTVADRSIPITLSRKTRQDPVERFRLRRVIAESEELRARLQNWAESAVVIEELRNAEPAMPGELGDRQADVTEPLVAIADLAGGDWPERARNALLELYASHRDPESDGVRLLRDVRTVLQSQNLTRIKTSSLIEALFEIEESPWASFWEQDWKRGNTKGPAQRLAALLKPFGITPKTLKFADETEAKGYSESDFEDSWTRYT